MYDMSSVWIGGDGRGLSRLENQCEDFLFHFVMLVFLSGLSGGHLSTEVRYLGEVVRISTCKYASIIVGIYWGFLNTGTTRC